MKYTSAFVRRLEDRKGRPWQGVLKYKGDDGSQRQKTKVFNPSEVKTEAAARKRLDAWRFEMEQAAEREAMAACAPSARSKPVAEYCRGYVDALGATGAIEPSTLADYRKSLGKLGELGDVPLGDLTASQVRAWEASLMEGGLSPVSVGKCHRVLKQCMRRAVEAGDLDRDPTLGVKPPKRPVRQPNALDAAGRARLVELLGQMGPTPLKAGAALALYAGMREGEICGLRWRNVDLDAGVLWVREAIGRGEGGTYAKEPKNGGSRREVPLCAALAAVLRERRGEMVSRCLDAGVPFSGDLYVIGEIDGRYRHPGVLGREWSTLARAYGLTGVTGARVTFHDLRHTFATAAIAEGVDVKAVSSVLGHANAAMTLNVYASADPDAKRRAADAVGEAMGRSAPAAEVIEFRKGAAGA